MCVYRITCPPFVATATSPYKFEELLLLFADHSRVCVFGTERMTSTGEPLNSLSPSLRHLVHHLGLRMERNSTLGHMLLNPSGQEISAEDVLIILASSARRALEIQAMSKAMNATRCFIARLPMFRTELLQHYRRGAIWIETEWSCSFLRALGEGH